MNAHEYNPKPIDTSEIVLPDELSELCEKLAQNVHDTWAIQRMNEGWTYGPERNDSLRQHPCLVPYDELPENEKDYDRNTAQATLKSICALGFKIVKA